MVQFIARFYSSTKFKANKVQKLTSLLFYSRKIIFRNYFLQHTPMQPLNQTIRGMKKKSTFERPPALSHHVPCFHRNYRLLNRGSREHRISGPDRQGDSTTLFNHVQVK